MGVFDEMRQSRRPIDANRVAAIQFLDTALDYPAQHFDGALVWDTLEFLSGPLLETVVRRLNLTGGSGRRTT